MKILFVSSYSLLYGANRSLLTIVCFLRDNGYQVKVFIPRHGEYEKALKENNIDYEVVSMFNQFLYYKPIKKYLILPFLIFWNVVMFPFYLLKIKKYNPDLIYSNAASECLGGLAAKCLGKKHLWHLREFMDRDYNARFYLGNKIRKKYINWSDGAIFVSKAVADAMLLGDDLNDNQKVIYNGVDIPPIELKETDLTKIHPNLGVVGVLSDGKGQKRAVELLPQIVKTFPHAQLHIFGDRENAYKQMLVELAKKEGVFEHVVFHGFQKDLNVIYNNMDILLMFSKSEGFGRVTIEAMNYGVPVIGFNNAGTSEIVKDGETGFLFNTDEQFMDSLKALMKDNASFNQVKREAYNVVREDFTVKQYCENVLSFVQVLLFNK